MANVIDSALAPDAARRDALVRRGVWLNLATLSYNLLEALVSLSAGVIAGSVALVAFGADSLIEVSAALAALWRLRSDADITRRARAEHASTRIVGLCFLAIAVYIIGDS